MNGAATCAICPTAVPEPSTFILLGTGTLAVSTARRSA
ncbi:PEP-CTERM sorting domain-containing protein [Luteitalea pratensis]